MCIKKYRANINYASVSLKHCLDFMHAIFKKEKKEQNWTALSKNRTVKLSPRTIKKHLMQDKIY